MTATRTDRVAGPVPTRARRRLTFMLLALIAVALVVLGGALAVLFGWGDDEPATPAASSVDAGFSRDMSTHHLQAVEMANLAYDRSTDLEVRGLAFDIAETQNNQVGQMRGWLALWGVTPTGGERMAWMGETHSGYGMSGMDMESDGALMPGMATEAELANLRSSSGTAFDVEFLRLMIRHHEGGSEMAQYAAGHADQSVVRSLAMNIADSQAAETSTMTDMLTARGGTPLPPP